MESFEPGWLPRGWTLETKIAVENSRYKNGPNIRLHPVGGDVSYATCDFDLADVDVIQFHYSKRYKVLAWLRWFLVDQPYARDFMETPTEYYRIKELIL